MLAYDQNPGCFFINPVCRVIETKLVAGFEPK